MSDTMTYSMSARLVPEPGTAALLRIVSILHSRCSDVRELTFHAGHARGATLTARVAVGSSGAATLQESIRRAVQVLDVAMTERIDVDSDPVEIAAR